jgi:hypothetical protein
MHYPREVGTFAGSVIGTKQALPFVFRAADGQADMIGVMSAHNECVEYQRLQRAYDDAIVVWEQDRHPNVQPIDRQKLTNEDAAKLRAEALVKRNIAANELYTHLRTCPACSHFKK